MKFIRSKRFQIGWGIWNLILGVSLAFFVMFQEISSFDEYINAFFVLDMPNSWCPTFLVLYGITVVISQYFGRVFRWISNFAGLMLLPIGLYATYEFTFHSMGDPLPMYIYAQTIHVTEILTGAIALFCIFKRK